MYRAVTRQIEVTVEPNFLPERSSVENGQYFWSYTIVITNSGTETVQLRTRHWIITDATGRKQEVRGEGVVGEQPVLAPGERFEYTSGVPLPTASGFRVSQINVNDRSVEGLRHASLPIETVQYHPEGAPGPLDALAVFDRFVAKAGRHRGGSSAR